MSARFGISGHNGQVLSAPCHADKADLILQRSAPHRSVPGTIATGLWQHYNAAVPGADLFYFISYIVNRDSVIKFIINLISCTFHSNIDCAYIEITSHCKIFKTAFTLFFL